MNPELNQRTSEPAGPRLVPRSENGGGEDAIGAALRSLPAEIAGPGFTARVLARLDEPRRERPVPVLLRPATAWAALAAAALVAAAGLAVMRSAPAPEDPARIAEARPDGSSPDASPRIAQSRPQGPQRPVPAGAPPAAGPRDGHPREGSAAASGAVPHGDQPLPAGAASPAQPAAAEPSSAESRAPRDERPDARSGTRRSAPPAPSDARLAASGSRAGAGDAHDALARLRTELDALRREHRRFEIGLADLPEVGRDGQPVVYVGGDEGLGLVLDLGRDTLPGDPSGDREPGTSL